MPGTYFYVLTLQWVTVGGFSTQTSTGTVTPPPGVTVTSTAVYETIRADLAKTNPRLRGASVVHFSLIPDQL